MATYDTGAATFTVTLGVGVAAGQFVSATTTDPAGNTSAFAACVAVSTPAGAGQTPLAVGAIALPYVREHPPMRVPASADVDGQAPRPTDHRFARWGPGAIPAPGSRGAESTALPHQGETRENASGFGLVVPAGETDDPDLSGWPS